MGLHGKASSRRRNIARDKFWRYRIAEVKECEIEWELRVGAARAGMKLYTAPKVHDDEQFFLGPGAQFSGSNADFACKGLSNFADNCWILGIRNIDNQNSGMGMRTLISGRRPCGTHER